MSIDTSKQPKMSFSWAAEDYIRRFMDAAMITAKHKFPTATSWIPAIDWVLESVMTLRATGETIRKGSYFDVGALETKYLTNESIVHLNNGLDVAIRLLPEDLTSADHIAFDLRDGYLVIPHQPGYESLPRPYEPN